MSTSVADINQPCPMVHATPTPNARTRAGSGATCSTMTVSPTYSVVVVANSPVPPATSSTTANNAAPASSFTALPCCVATTVGLARREETGTTRLVEGSRSTLGMGRGSCEDGWGMRRTMTMGPGQGRVRAWRRVCPRRWSIPHVPQPRPRHHTRRGWPRLHDDGLSSSGRPAPRPRRQFNELSVQRKTHSARSRDKEVVAALVMPHAECHGRCLVGGAMQGGSTE